MYTNQALVRGDATNEGGRDGGGVGGENGRVGVCVWGGGGGAGQALVRGDALHPRGATADISSEKTREAIELLASLAPWRVGWRVEGRPF